MDKIPEAYHWKEFWGANKHSTFFQAEVPLFKRQCPFFSTFVPYLKIHGTCLEFLYFVFFCKGFL